MIAVVKKDISVLIKKGDRLKLIGKNFILEGDSEPFAKRVEITFNGKKEVYWPPNYYPKKQVQQMKDYFKIIK